ncbi:hypothetical protein BC936DRAFT_147463 [Jimgerdemannia flammicorona]|uniref:Large ribosomal subunit protein mL53 n=1 Tax=Jimgerdemannia flammicorona TaxID=994334 RepID=A0A433D586_9FUNG|nr:hypothetical protein BC936DRAFT_147463 [Jimgerdemannia flammicorona]
MLMKHINEVKVTLAPFSITAKSSRLFLARIMTDKARIANPALKVSTTILSDVDAKPSINVTYRDGKKLEVQAGEMNIDSVIMIVNKHAKKLQEEQDATA